MQNDKKKVKLQSKKKRNKLQHSINGNRNRSTKIAWWNDKAFANETFRQNKNKLSEIINRRDFRKTLTFTIDPYSAKDFDDAISYKILDKGVIEVGIHIADVSYYVKENTLLDKEAYNRATSVYLVDRVVPMLPEILSNNLCSLKPNEDKYTFSAVFNIDEKGSILSEWFGRTVINSNKRFSEKFYTY